MFVKRCALFLAILGIFLLPDLQADFFEEPNPCQKEMLLSFFPEAYVKNTLEKFDVPEEKWDKITSRLIEKNQDIVPMIEKKTEDMHPNPLQDPELRGQAVKIFRETLLEIFSGVMTEQGISDKQLINQMFDDLQKQKAHQFSRCLLE